MKRYQILMVCGCVLLTVEVAVIAFITRERPCLPEPVRWTTIKSNPASSRERVLLDAIIEDILTSPDLTPVREGALGQNSNVVRYANFPVDYTPKVKGYAFEPQTNRPSFFDDHLVIDLRGLWLDQDAHDMPLGVSPILFSIRDTKRGAVLQIYNHGAGLVGSCTVAYAIETVPAGWRISYIGAEDP